MGKVKEYREKQECSLQEAVRRVKRDWLREQLEKSSADIFLKSVLKTMIEAF